MPHFTHDGIQFFYRDSGGEGVPFIFQHGLGGDVEQPFGLFSPPAGLRLLAFDCRAHGQTQPLGEPAKIKIAQFSADLAYFLDYLGIERAIIGGISMGAALALRFALDQPQRVRGLVLSRPAWLDGPGPAANQTYFGQVARLLREHGAAQGVTLFSQSDSYRRLRQESPDVADSLLNQFYAPQAEARAGRLEQIPAEAPHPDRAAWGRISVATLVLANEQDPFHPFSFGQQLGQAIPGASFYQITAKSVSRPQHEAEVQARLEQFVQQFL